MLYCSLKSRGLTAWLWLFKSASRHEAVNMARPGLAYLGSAWPGSRPQAGPCTALPVTCYISSKFFSFPLHLLLLIRSALVRRLYLSRMKKRGFFYGHDRFDDLYNVIL